jgi:asparagine synthetase B (glutamine-hydrolysing)
VTVRSLEAIERTAPQGPDDGWVFALSLDQPTRLQPSGVRWTQRGPVSSFFHGLLFDREALANSIGCNAPDYSDAECVLRAYEREGEAVLSRLRGSFVLAIIDRTRDRAIVARDPLGSCPLFYAEANSHVLFAVSPRALLNQPGVSRAVNRAALADHLCHRWPDLHETFFAAVRRLPMGWRAAISGGRVHVERFWDPAPEDRPVQWLTADEIHFDKTFDRAIDRCLQDGPTGIFLSGGLDSISVAAFATDRARKTGQPPPLALSLGFPDPECDEQERQRAIARDLGLRQELVDFNEALGSRPLSEQWIELNRYLSAPLLNFWMPAYLGLARRGRDDGIRTILSGHGGDEWLTVSPFLSADLIRDGKVTQLLILLRTLWRSNQFPPHQVARSVIWTFGLKPLIAQALNQLSPARKSNRAKRLMARDPHWIAPDQDLRREQLRRVQNAMGKEDSPQGFYLRQMRDSLDHPLVSWELDEQYEIGRRLGIRFMNPFWDPDLVELLYRTPPGILNTGGRSKGLVRGTLAERFPTLGFERHRKVSATNFSRSLQLREGPSLLREVGDFAALAALGVVNGPSASAALREALDQGSRPGLTELWLLLDLEMWVRAQQGAYTN